MPPPTCPVRRGGGPLGNQVFLSHRFPLWDNRRKKKVTKSNRKKIKAAAASGCYNICSAYFVKQCIVAASWVFGKQGLMWVAFPLSPLPPVHPRVKEIQSREPKVAEHEVERKRERKGEQKKQGKGKLIWEKKGVSSTAPLTLG